MTGTYNIKIYQGATWTIQLRCTSDFQNVNNISFSNNVVTMEVFSHDFSVGDKVFVSGADQSVYNGLFTVASIVNDNVFTYSLSPSITPTFPATGRIKVAKITDLTGYQARMQIRPSRDSDVVTEEITSTGGGISITAGSGVIMGSIDAVSTASLDFDDTFYYELELINGAIITRLVEGDVVLVKGGNR